MNLEIRVLSHQDSIVALTQLLHQAYAGLGAMGLNYTAVDQSNEVTAQRVSKGTCFVAVSNGNIVGTLTVQTSNPDSPCPEFAQPDTAHIQQFAVEPGCQGQGIGSQLLARAEEWAIEQGCSKLALDTAEPASHLLKFYDHRGYTPINAVQWSEKAYRSVILCKHLCDR